VFQLQHRIPGPLLLLFNLKKHVSAHHHPGQLHLVGALCQHISADLTGPQHRDVVGQVHDLGQLMGDQNDAGAIVSYLLQSLEQPGDLLGCQHRRGLVHDQHVRAQIQGFQNLYPLL